MWDYSFSIAKNEKNILLYTNERTKSVEVTAVAVIMSSKPLWNPRSTTYNLEVETNKKGKLCKQIEVK